ncbi:MAG: choice-of-anchor P family protein [Rhizomicrobium sp.]
MRGSFALKHRIVLPALGALAVIAAGMAGPANAADMKGAFTGNAYATFANDKAGLVATTLGRSAYQSCPCAGTDGKTLKTEVDTISVPGVLSAGTTVSTAFAKKTADKAEVQNTASIKNLNALGGMITADSITAVADVSATADTIAPSADASTFSNLVVAGQHIPANVPENTVIPLNGLGSATLYAVKTIHDSKQAGAIQVDMLTITIKTKNTLGLAVGSKIVIGHAIAGFHRKEPAVAYDGTAYGALANGSAGDDLANKIGRSAFMALACNGTSGKNRSRTAGTVNVSGIMSLGEVGATAFGGKEGGADVARMTATASDVNLLGGLISATGIQAVAQSSLAKGVSTGSADGSGFTGLTILGLQLPLNTPPNTQVDLPGIGTVTVNEQTIKNDGSVVVNGLHIVVSSTNLLGLPVGTDLVVAHANASATPFK